MRLALETNGRIIRRTVFRQIIIDAVRVNDRRHAKLSRMLDEFGKDLKTLQVGKDSRSIPVWPLGDLARILWPGAQILPIGTLGKVIVGPAPAGQEIVRLERDLHLLSPL